MNGFNLERRSPLMPEVHTLYTRVSSAASSIKVFYGPVCIDGGHVQNTCGHIGLVSSASLSTLQQLHTFILIIRKSQTIDLRPFMSMPHGVYTYSSTSVCSVRHTSSVILRPSDVRPREVEVLRLRAMDQCSGPGFVTSFISHVRRKI